MKVFHCDHCQHLLFFENTVCVKCGHELAYLPDLADLGSLEPAGEGLWRRRCPRHGPLAIAFVENYADDGRLQLGAPADDRTRCACRAA